MKNITSESFTEEVLNFKGQVIVDFYATWCGPCKKQAELLDKLQLTFPEVKIVSVDVDQEADLAQTYQVKSLPTLLIVTQGNVTHRKVGLTTDTSLGKLLKE